MWCGCYSSDNTARDGVLRQDRRSAAPEDSLIWLSPVPARCRAAVQDAASHVEGFRHLEMPWGSADNRLTQAAGFEAVGFPTSAAGHFMAHQSDRWPQSGAYHHGPCPAGPVQAPGVLHLFWHPLLSLCPLPWTGAEVPSCGTHRAASPLESAHTPVLPALQVSVACRLFLCTFHTLRVQRN